MGVAVKTKLNLLGFEIDRYSYDNGSYLYPSFNGNAEYKCTRKGVKDLCRYLRNIRWVQNQRKEMDKIFFGKS